MLSVIIPTLLRPNSLFKIVDKLIKTPIVGEIIIINNSLEPIQFNSKKVIIHTPNTNLYVNLSWNLGVSMAKHDVICICNDDINFDVNKLFYLHGFIVCKGGLLGPSSKCFSKNNNKLKINSTFERNYGYGTLMLMKKCDFNNIPENLKIWCGDDYLFHSQEKKNHSFTGLFIETDMETTSSLIKFNNIKKDDLENYPYSNYSPYLNKFKFQYFFYKIHLIKKLIFNV